MYLIFFQDKDDRHLVALHPVDSNGECPLTDLHPAADGEKEEEGEEKQGWHQHSGH